MMIENLTLSGTPKIVLSVKDHAWAVQTNGEQWFDLVEFRIDLFASIDIHPFVGGAGLMNQTPTILTIRSKREGGGFQGSESKRLLLFKKIMPHVSAVDIELSSDAILGDVVSNAHDAKKKVIISFHDFNKTPSLVALNRVLKGAKVAGADIVKVAAFAKDHKDIQKLARFTVEHADQHIVTIAMGEVGALSRLFFPALGSLLTYTFYGDKTAPGQIDCQELSRLVKRFYPK